MDEKVAQVNCSGIDPETNESCGNMATKTKEDEQLVHLESLREKREETLQNQTRRVDATLQDMVSSRDTSVKELKETKETMEGLKQRLLQEKLAGKRYERELRVVRYACSEIEGKLKELLTQMLSHKTRLVGVDSKAKQSVDQVPGLDVLKMLKQEELTKLEAELRHVKAAYSVLEEQSKNEVTLVQQILNKRIKENVVLLSNLQETLNNRERTITVLEEQLRKAKESYNDRGERLGREIKEIKQRKDNEFALRCLREDELKEKEAFLNELEEKLRAEKESRERKEKELTCRSATEQSLRQEISQMQNDLVQFQEKVENETCRRRTIEHQLEENVSTVRRRAEEELNHAREKERLLEIERRWRQTMEIQLNEKKIMLDGAQETIFQLTDELNEVRRSTNEDLERLQQHLNQEISLRNRKEQELSVLEQLLEEKENALSEQRHLLGEERQQRATSEESLRTVQREMMDYRHRQEARETELQSQLSAAHESLAEYQPRNWIIRREEVVVSETSLGRGAWGSVHRGTFRCCPVAVKEIHEVILSDYNRELFEREMTFASRSRHPNLLQFIAATIDDGSPLFVTELLDTSLRDLLSQQVLVDSEICNLAIDIARGLNYLHLNEPLPIVHRDISSANVLLYRRGESWSAKLSDYGSANFVRQLMTVNPGASIYAAPEASTSNSTTKMDVYSYGVLLCEMCTRELPNPVRRDNQIRQVAGTSLRRLITRCTMTDPDQRPAMCDILS